MNAKQGAYFLKFSTWFFRCEEPQTIIEKVYGKKFEEGNYDYSYLSSKLKLLQKDNLSWFADLDSEHQERFCQAVIDKYNSKCELD